LGISKRSRVSSAMIPLPVLIFSDLQVLLQALLQAFFAR